MKRWHMMRCANLKPHFSPLILLLSICLIFLSLSYLQQAIAAEGASSVVVQQNDKASEGKKYVTFNMVDTDITVLIQSISALIGKTFIIDSNVRGKVNVISPEKISVQEAYQLFESVLEVNGYALVPAGAAIKVVPSSEARSKNIETRVSSGPSAAIKSSEDKLITQLIPLTYADAKEVKTLLTPLVSKNSIILSYADTNTLIVTDVESNIKRLLRILKAIDVPGIGREVSVIPLLYANAETLTKTLSSIFKTSMSSEKDASQKTLEFVSDERTNSIIFVANEDDTARIKQLITLLDKDTPKGTGKAHVYSLLHANAEDMAKVLQELPKESTASASASSEKGAKEAVFVSNDISITADKPTNSLIIFADNADYAVIKDIIEKLDIPRSMVYIEALIMEVSVDKSFELGVQWSAFDDTTINGKNAVVGGGFSASGGFDPTSLVSTNGMAIGVVAGSVNLTTSQGTVSIPNLGALINALQTNQDVHILQTPKLLATDNEEASIVVGKVVPYQTRTSTSNNDTYNSYEYKDVGLTLKITPHISSGRNVRLEIYQELSALSNASTDITTTPTTLNRTVQTTVIVQDQNMLVIGGLIDDNITNTVKKMPILGSIPILGHLFRYDSQTGNKTNLYIFITPRVVKNPSEAIGLTSDVQEKLTPEESGLIKLYGPSNITKDKNKPSESGSAE